MPNFQKSSMANKTGGTKKHNLILTASFVLFLLIFALLSLCLGTDSYSPTEVLRVLLTGDTESTAYRIIMYVRLPRICAAVLAGGALAVSGGIIQAVLNNPLASPNIIGVNSGAGLMVLLCAAFLPAGTALLPLAAFIGALITAMLILFMSLGSNASKLTIILTGIAVSSIFGAGMNTVMIIDPDAYIGSASFLVGGLATVTMEMLKTPALYIAAGLLAALFCCNDLNILALGKNTAHSLGMNVTLHQFLLMSVAAVLAGAAVSFAGLLGFVGLIVPHAVRFVMGNDNRYVIPASALAGMAFVVLCDMLARILFLPYEIPVGILMAFIGGPFFIYLIFRTRRYGKC
ncbi:MAG: FecCD family ABC transporter permease [Bacillota bacterium]|jgi:iron complex transport system permease protein